MKPTRPLSPAAAFFFEWAGWGYEPATETAEEGRTRTAEMLAAAEERYMAAHLTGKATCLWKPDPDGHAFWKREQKEGRAHIGRTKKCEQAWIVDGEGNPLASLGAILDADENYRRVVRAELACEAFPPFHNF